MSRPVAPSLVPLSERLRSETSPFHREAETVLGLPDSLQTYGWQLRLLRGYLLAWESALNDARERFGSVVHSSERVAWLDHDLQALGLTPAQIAASPRMEELPRFDSIEKVLGTLYVWEGSTLGGQMIAQRAHQLGVPANAITYYTSHGAEVGLRWRKFKDALNAASSPTADPIIIAGATQTFAALCSWAHRFAQHAPR